MTNLIKKLLSRWSDKKPEVIEDEGPMITMTVIHVYDDLIYGKMCALSWELDGKTVHSTVRMGTNITVKAGETIQVLDKGQTAQIRGQKIAA